MMYLKSLPLDATAAYFALQLNPDYTDAQRQADAKAFSRVHGLDDGHCCLIGENGTVWRGRKMNLEPKKISKSDQSPADFAFMVASDLLMPDSAI